MGEIQPSSVTATCRVCSKLIPVGEPCFAEVVGGSPPLHRDYHLTCAATARPTDLASALAAHHGTLPDRTALVRLVAGHSLWIDVANDPDNDEPRSVLSDFLQGEGDPRGELVALQLAGAHDRAEELLQRHGHAWLGELRRIARGARFERGFVSRLELNNVGDDVVRVSVDRDAVLTFGTIEDLIPDRARARTYAWLLGGAGMRALRRVEVWERDTVAALAGIDAPLVEVACGLRQVDTSFLDACMRLPRLASLIVTVVSWKPIVKSPLLGRLTRLSVVGRIPLLNHVRAIWSGLPRALVIRVLPDARLESCVDERDWLELAPSVDGLVVRASAAWATPELVDQLAAWPDRVSRVELETTSNSVIVRLRHIAKRLRLKLEFVERPLRRGYVRGGQRA